jgi:hypothetical protein
MKRMDIREFVERGFLQEANRNFFHPLGLALEVSIGPYGNYSITGVWDERGDPEGIVFADPPSLLKAATVGAEHAVHAEPRMRAFGYVIQPTGSTE